MNDLASTLLDTAATVAGYASCAADFQKLSDADVVALTRAIADHKRQLGAFETHAAAEVARRSRREFGHGGLAAREGFASPEKLLESVSKVTGREAAQLVSLGRSLDDATATQGLLDAGVIEIAGEPLALPWDAPITAAVACGELSVECAGALRRGLGLPTEQFGIEVLRELAMRLVAETADLSADRAFRAARLQRDLIDATGVKARQQELYERGGFRLYAKANGMYGFAGEADPESAAVLSAALDPLTSPRRGGPRFVDPADRARAQAILDDPRSTERITLDGLVELVKLGAGVDPQKMYGRVRPVVKIIVTEQALHTGTGFGILESDQTPVSQETVDAGLCAGDSLEVTVTVDGMPLNVGRTKRLYDQRQREALAVRDGGCLWPGCNRPPAMTEAHHTRQWKRDNGNTDLDDGVLLCRFHHMLLHNNHWEIGRHRLSDGSNDLWLTPPASVDPAQTRLRLESKNPLLRRRPRERTG
ncbi:MAG TPA: DUF222 domain-containing protein [Terrimesophilobacter sp.]|jgi:Domain of unknown function DUF222.|uniref:HNH endonuclease signature motif containing protein n=1 Tax=Terrimesophilobacter sp. TaxID=2906435 RepID=UPI002F944DEB